MNTWSTNCWCNCQSLQLAVSCKFIGHKIIAFKSAIWDFWQSPHCAANCLQYVRNHVQIMCNTSSTYHMQYIMLHATWYEGTTQLLRQSLNHIYSGSILLAEPLNRLRRGGNRSTQRKPQRRASENATYYSPKIQALSKTQTHTIALVAG